MALSASCLGQGNSETAHTHLGTEWRSLNLINVMGRAFCRVCGGPEVPPRTLRCRTRTSPPGGAEVLPLSPCRRPGVGFSLTLGLPVQKGGADLLAVRQEGRHTGADHGAQSGPRTRAPA